MDIFSIAPNTLPVNRLIFALSLSTFSKMAEVQQDQCSVFESLISEHGRSIESIDSIGRKLVGRRAY